MHPALLQMYEDARPSLEATESLTLATAVAIGTGSMKREEADATLRELRRAAGGGRRAAADRPAGEADLAALSALGIAVELPEAEEA